MTIASHDWPTLSRLLDTALSLSEQERLSWLEGLGGEHASLKDLLRELLSREDLAEQGGFLSTLPKIISRPNAIRADTAAGDVVGPYRLERQLGIGGMGSVWLAERIDGLVKRKVALKLPHLVGAITGLAERMARERNILAALEHPNIARLYDAGVGSDGRPYLALEYVEGQPIDAYCRDHGLELRARLDLVLQVARAVAFAHAHLVVHRDLKPSNILVDATGRVHLLDFGIAKLLDSKPADPAQITQFADGPMTPNYASPEQIRGELVSTASDVYSLGVVLYELLAGTRPYKLPEGVDALSLAQAIVSCEPLRPSQATRSARRTLRGDLDTIVLKALKKLPSERYATIAEFGDDIERYLRGDPVRARPDSFGYRATKFIGRNKLVVGAAAAVGVALAVGLGIALWQTRMLRAEQRTSQAQEQFLEDIFRANSNDQSDPAKARQTTVRDLLRNGASMVDRSLQDAPASKLRVLGTLAQMHNDLQLWDDAVELNRKRVMLARRFYGRDDSRLVDMLIDLSTAMIGSKENVERKQALDEAAEILDRRGDNTSMRRARLLGELSSYYSERDPAKALEYVGRGVSLLRSLAPSKDLIDSIMMQGWLLNVTGQYRRAEMVLTEAVTLSQEMQGRVNSRLPVLHGYLAEPQYNLQEFASAEGSLRRGLQIARSLKGEADGDAIQLEARLGSMLFKTSRVEEGLAHCEHARAMIEKTRGLSDPLYTPEIYEVYGRSLAEAGRLQDGLRYLSRVTNIWRQYRPGSAYVMAAMEEEASVRIALGDLASARSLLDEAQKIRDRSGDRMTNLNGNVTTRIAFLLASGRSEEAAQVANDYYLPPGHGEPTSLAAMQVSLTRAEVELARGRSGEADRLARQVHGQVVASPQRIYLKMYEARAALDEGKALELLGEHTRASVLLRDAVDLAAQVYDQSLSPVLADALIALAGCLIDLHRIDDARLLEARASAIHTANADLGTQYREPLAALQARLRMKPHVVAGSRSGG